MRAVAIDAATLRAGVALWEDGLVLAKETHEIHPLGVAHGQVPGEPAHHGERLLGMVDTTFARAGWARTSIDLCVCGIGPGSFTGTRIGLATAKGLAWALNRPIVGIGALETMVGGLAGEDAPAHATVLALLNAGRGEVFAAIFNQSGQLLHGPLHVPATSLLGASLDALAGPILVIGEAAASVARAAVEAEAWSVHRSGATDLPDAGVLARMGVERFIASGPDDLDALEPLYVRPPEITLPKTR